MFYKSGVLPSRAPTLSPFGPPSFDVFNTLKLLGKTSNYQSQLRRIGPLSSDWVPLVLSPRDFDLEVVDV